MTDPIDRETQVRQLAQRKGFVLRRAQEGRDLWHVMTPYLDSSVYSLSMANPHTFTLDEARRLLLAREDAVRN